MKPLTYSLQQNTERVAVMYLPYLPRVAALLAVVCALSAFLYGAFLLEAVAQAASRTTAERQIEALQSQLGTLEGQYLSATQTLTPERAVALGFVAPKIVSTVVVDSEAASLSFVSR
jgi:cytochrome c-type biogenesis protein CcmH/NrfG